jgi:hypothetical protein
MGNIRELNFYTFCLLFILAVVSDFLTVYLGYRLSVVPRLVLLITCMYGCLAYRTSLNQFTPLLALIAIWLIQNCLSLLYFSERKTVFIVENIALTLKIISFPLIYYWLRNIRHDFFLVVVKIAKLSLSIYVLTIVLSPLLGWSSLLTYGDTGRFGYKGVIAAGNESATIILIACFWAAKDYIRDKTLFRLAVMCLALCSSVLIGTKAGILIFTLVIVCVFVINFREIRVTHRLFVVFLVVLGFFYVRLTILPDIIEVLQLSMSYFESKLQSTSLGSYVSLLLSGRETKLYFILNSLADKDYMFIFFGGYPISEYMVEMDYFDIVFLMGFPIGTLIFLSYLKLIWVNSHGCFVDLMFFTLFIVISILAGHVLFSMVHSPMLAAYLINNRLQHNVRCLKCYDEKTY